MKRTSIYIIFALTTTCGLMFAADPTPNTNKAELRRAIKTAKTPADQERIAEYYTQSANDFRAQQAEEERLAAHYAPSIARIKVPSPYASTMKLASHFADEADQATPIG